jgi:hypothetical protein
MPKSFTCEVPKTTTSWHEISVEKALSLGVRMRCPECKGAVRPHNAAQDGSMEAHFEHLERHDGCSLGNYFSGVETPHPHPL